ncbi:Beta-lactamase [Ruminococcaceae bacterium YRB3002]|nr:Beta-lactamase [Ruminococcaceae bacterium YRB3002]
MRNGRITLVVLSVIAAAVMFTACGRNDISDYSVAYYDNGSVEYTNKGDGTDEHTVFELASNGKTVAAYTALAMADEGVFSLDDNIIQYLGNDLVTGDQRMNDITIRQLLCHTAGFSPSYELGVDKKIHTDPGTEFCYSGVGYIYLQSVIENASGMTLDQAASHYVFEPLGMNNSTFAGVKTITPYMALSNAVLYAMLMFVLSFYVLLLVSGVVGKISKFKYYTFKTAFVVSFAAAGIINTVFLLFFFVSKVFILFLIIYALMGTVLAVAGKHSKLFYASVPVLTAALFVLAFVIPVSIPVTNDLIDKAPNCAYTFRSTCEDMAVFCEALMDKANDPDGQDQMFLPAVKIDDKNAWGLGVAIEESDGQGTMYWHSGINPGFQSLYVLCPDQNRYIVVLTNSDSGLDLARELARDFLGIDGEWDIKRG